MGYPTKVQLIKRKASEQWYINFPAAVAHAMEFNRGEIVEWIIEDRANLILHRTQVPPSALKKNCGLPPLRNRGALGAMQAGLRARANLAAGKKPHAKLSGLLGQTYHNRPAVHQRAPARRLVCRLPPLFTNALRSRRSLRHHPPGRPRPPPPARASGGGHGRLFVEKERNQNPRRGVSPRPLRPPLPYQLCPRSAHPADLCRLAP